MVFLITWKHQWDGFWFAEVLLCIPLFIYTSILWIMKINVFVKFLVLGPDLIPKHLLYKHFINLKSLKVVWAVILTSIKLKWGQQISYQIPKLTQVLVQIVRRLLFIGPVRGFTLSKRLVLHFGDFCQQWWFTLIKYYKCSLEDK